MTEETPPIYDCIVKTCAKCGLWVGMRPSETICSACKVETPQSIKAQLKSLSTEPLAWRQAALFVGEHLGSVGPKEYYELSPDGWGEWAANVADHLTSTIDQLRGERDEAIRKWMAYREVAIRQDLVSTNPSANREKAEQYCDEEASRLLAERRQSD